ncbi:response regulator [Hymenobacter sp. NBH84]|uniref:Response regulator n=1 Tax=Hymenobacter defluvii TaxID=2054411 RepID=A0ABS3TA12_9BACT|nr:response regulator [Hymenobacter sp. NBH84]MBO3270486.1 response regulator [Hymenobacter defluvii]QNE39862.1 response regulator [Hymenobacter sp. NBH84]
MEKLPCILLVDDDPVNNFLNQHLLENLAVADQLLVAQNGQEAFTLLQQHHQPEDHEAYPALVLLDVNMPVMNGLEFLQAYRQLPPAQQQALVIVMLTNSLQPQEIARAQQLHVADFLSKPLTREKIDTVLQTHFHYTLPVASTPNA